MIIKRLLLCGILILLTISPGNLIAQVSRSLQCGDILEGEVLPGSEQYDGNTEKGWDDYLLQMPAGTRINLVVEPLGSTFNAAFVIVDAGNNDILITNEVIEGEAEQLTDYQIGASNLTLRVFGLTPGGVGSERGRFYGYYDYKAGYYFGAYQIRLGCTLRDGTVIEPGEAPAEQSSSAGSNTSIPEFSGFGFPGLAPVDFSAAAKLPLIPDTPITGAITPNGGEILGFAATFNEGDVISLEFNRLSGNLNVGIIVLSADNKVVFQTSLVTSSKFSTEIPLPSGGEYIVGVFQVSLVPPTIPEATAFTIQLTVNPPQ